MMVVNFSDDMSYTDPDFPTSGDGLFTVKDYPDEVFLNPNTFSTALTYCVNYAMDEIVDGGGGTNNTYTTNTTYSGWQDVQRTDNLLSTYAHWKQKTPFNDLYPQKEDISFLDAREKRLRGVSRYLWLRY